MCTIDNITVSTKQSLKQFAFLTYYHIYLNITIPKKLTKTTLLSETQGMHVLETF